MEPVDLSIDTAATRERLVAWLRSEITHAGFSRAVVNLSGGLDSALSCYLAAEALGPENVLAIRLPWRTSSPDSLAHAQLVIDALGVQALTLEITPMLEPLFAAFPGMSDLRKGNAMARQRMIVLFDQSAAFQGLAVGTSNKSEILLGYSTIYGDSACALNPLGDLYKTQVRQLSAALGVPQPIIEKPPSADLWIGQTDEGELGFTYAELDRLLFLLVEKRWAPEDCVVAGFAEAFVRGVLRRMHRSHFKRVMPPIAKLTDQTVGIDFRYPAPWGSEVAL